jgi:hypothetical protein
MNNFFELTIDGNNLELIIDTKRDHWFLLFPEHGQYASGSIGSGSYERNHNFLRIGSKDYELVIDCDDNQTHWDSWSIFDVEKQEYLSISGKIYNEGANNE